MTEPNGQDSSRKIVVPGQFRRTESIDPAEEFEGLVSQADIGSASRSCLAIIVVLAIIGLLLCVFLVGTVVV